MKDDKLNQLFSLARRETAPPVPPEFAANIMARLSRQDTTGPASISDQLNLWFPRLAVASAMAIFLCLGLEFALSSFSSADFSEQVAQVSLQWLLP